MSIASINITIEKIRWWIWVDNLTLKMYKPETTTRKIKAYETHSIIILALFLVLILILNYFNLQIDKD